MQDDGCSKQSAKAKNRHSETGGRRGESREQGAEGSEKREERASEPRVKAGQGQSNLSRTKLR